MNNKIKKNYFIQIEKKTRKHYKIENKNKKIKLTKKIFIFLISSGIT
jgi:hypothetical protein